MSHTSQVMSHKSQVTGQESQGTSQESWVTSHESKVKSKVIGHKLQVTGQESQVISYESQVILHNQKLHEKLSVCKPMKHLACIKIVSTPPSKITWGLSNRFLVSLALTEYYLSDPVRPFGGESHSEREKSRTLLENIYTPLYSSEIKTRSRSNPKLY